MRYDKPAITVAEQIEKLRQRGLIIDDNSSAEHFLSNISYYRLTGYWWSLQADKKTHQFKKGSSFSTVIDIYNFDRELRLLVFDMVERIEVSIRTHLIYELSLEHTAWWFENKELFVRAKHWESNIDVLKKEIKRSKEVFIQEHTKKYSDSDRLPPAWKAFEVISLGLLSKFYADLKNIPEKKKIAKTFYIGSQIYLVSWLRSLTVVRNICAHHSRLWNRNLPSPPKLLDRAPLPWIREPKAVDRHSFYALFVCLNYLLQTISPNNQFIRRFDGLLAKYPNIDIKAMGFSLDWRSEPLFKQFIS